MKTHLISSQSWKKLLLPVLVAGSLLALPVSTRATLPNTGSGNLNVVFGTATYPTLASGTSGALNFTISSNITVLGWSHFLDGVLPGDAGGVLAAGDIINFVLPSTSSAVLNQVTGGATTTINGGTISSNGKVFILNPAGIAIGSTGSISAASFYASTIPETLAYFESNGNLQVFTSTPPANSTAGNVTVAGGAQLSTVGGAGTIGFAGNSVSIGGAAATTVAGNLYLESQGGAIAVSAGAGGLTVGSATAGGNLTVVSNGGAIDLANGSATTVWATATVSSAGAVTNGAVTATNNFSATTAGTLSTINAGTGTTAGAVTLANIADNVDFASIGVNGTNVAISTANSIALGASNINGTLAVTSGTGSINNTGAVAATGNISLTANTAGKSITFSTTGNVGFGAINSTGIGNSVTITGTGNLALTGATSSPTVSITTTGGSITDTGGIGGTTTKATLTATGNINFNAAESVATLAATSSAGAITQTGAGTITSATLATFTAPTITLTTAANAITNVVLVGGGGSSTTPVQLADTVGTLTIAKGTNVTGATTIVNNGAAANIAIGTLAADVVTFGSTLGLTANGTGTITTVSSNFNVGGNVSANTTNSAITLGAAASTNSSFGQVSGSSGTASFTINESATTNLGGIIVTTPGVLTVVSAGNIVNTSGAVSASGGVALSAGTVASPGTIQIGSSATNAVIPGTVTLNIASGLTLWDKPAAALTVATGANTVASEAIWVTDGSALTVNGASGFGTLSFNVGAGAVNITDPTSLTIMNAVNTGAGSVTASATAGSITLGSGVSLAGTTGVSLTATGTGGLVADTAASPVFVFGPLTVSSKNIALNNNTANNIGQVFLTSTGNLAYTEGGTVNIGNITMTGSSGTLAVTSVGGSIIQGAGATGLVVPATVTAASFAAPAGAVTLNLGALNTILGGVPISITAGGAGAGGNSTLVNNAPTALGNVNVTNGTFTVSTLASGGAITQATGTSIFEYGTGTFTTQGGAITLANAGNNFGGLAIDSTNAGAAAAGANIKVREAGTNNYLSVASGTGGTFTAIDDTANIIQTGAGGIVVGGASSLTAVAAASR